MSPPQTFDILVFTTLTDEYNAVLQVLQEDGVLSSWNEIQDQYSEPLKWGYINRTKGSAISVLLARGRGMGELLAASRIYELARRFSFLGIAMCGVCAGDPDKIRQGDVIFAETVWKFGPGKVIRNYSFGKPSEARKNDLVYVDVKPDAFCRNAEDLSRTFQEENGPRIRSSFPEPLRGKPIPKVHVGMLQTVPDVTIDQMAFSKTPDFKRNTCGLEMEGYGVALAAKRLDLKFWFIAKGVQDFARPLNGESDKNDIYRPVAAYASAVFTIAFIRRHVTGSGFPISHNTPPLTTQGLLSLLLVPNKWTRSGMVLRHTEYPHIFIAPSNVPKHSAPKPYKSSDTSLISFSLTNGEHTYTYLYTQIAHEAVFLPAAEKSQNGKHCTAIHAYVGRLISCISKWETYTAFLSTAGITIQ